MQEKKFCVSVFLVAALLLFGLTKWLCATQDADRHGSRAEERQQGHDGQGHHGAVTSLPRVADPMDRPAVFARGAAHGVLLDVTTAGNRVVAVGERGIVVFSDDGGKTWRQAKVPTSVSLAAVSFPTSKKGWAVGHAGIVLYSEDGGETWTKQLDGKEAAKLALDAAQVRQQAKPGDPAVERQLTDAQRLAADGPDKPFLSLHFENETSGFIVGAYNLIFRTDDGGKSWKPWSNHVDNPKGLHIYAIRASGNVLYLAGEQGLFLRSTDRGNTFQRLPTPYTGTYFAIGVAPSGEIVLVGLRGNAYSSTDQGKTFTKAEVPVPISFSAVTALTDGRFLFSNQAGQLLESRDSGRTLQPLPGPQLPPLAALVQVDEGLVMTAGVAGAIPIPISGIAPAAKTGGPR